MRLQIRQKKLNRIVNDRRVMEKKIEALQHENEALLNTAETWNKRYADEHEKYLDLAESVRDTAARITSLLDELSCESYADV